MFSSEADEDRTIGKEGYGISFFGCKRDSVLIEYLKKGKSINSEYYYILLDQLDANIHEKWPSLQRKKIFFIKSMQVFTEVVSQRQISTMFAKK